MNRQNLHVFNTNEAKKNALIVVAIEGKKYIDAISLKVEGKTLNRCYHKNVSFAIRKCLLFFFFGRVYEF